MERGQCVQDTLPAMYGIMIAFLTCLVGYALWVSKLLRYFLSFVIDLYVFNISRCLLDVRQ